MYLFIRFEGRNKERTLPSAWLTAHTATIPKAQGKSQRKELHSTLLHGWLGPK